MPSHIRSSLIHLFNVATAYDAYMKRYTRVEIYLNIKYINMNLKFYTLCLCLLFIFTNCRQKQETLAQNPDVSTIPDNAKKPNIVIIYLDDLGYGDLGCYGAPTLKTPHIDALANGGVKFTNGYATSATCTPSRYGLLTGVYPWKNKQAKILPGTAPLILDTTQLTLPKLLKKEGYHTGIVGKWHLGLGIGQVEHNRCSRTEPGGLRLRLYHGRDPGQGSDGLY